MSDDFVLLAGSANPHLAQAIAAYLDHPLCQGETVRFSREAIRRIDRRESISVLFR